MRRLTLILSDLYLPAGTDSGALRHALDLPNLEWLLRFARPVERVDDWRTWLARQLGAGAIAELPIAHAIALSEGVEPQGAWLATPVSLEARLDHVRLRDGGLLSVTLEEGVELEEQFTRTFGPGLRLKHISSSGFLLLGGPRAAVGAVDPARLLDSDIAGALPTDSAAARELRKLGTEIEMWLHSAPTNHHRELARKRPISALWLWGGGAASRESAPRIAWSDFRVYGDDPYVRALAHLKEGQATHELSTRFEDIPTGTPVFVEHAPLSRPTPAGLNDLDLHWFAPARAALTEGSLDLTLVANDRVFRVPPRQGWKFWRRRKRWLESLGA